jgi:hypothetical protein
MTTDRRLIGAALGLALLVAACGGSASTSPAASAASSQAAAATSAPTDAAASTDTSGGQSPDASVPDISLAPGNASDLEAMLPDKVGTITITKTSMDYSSIPWASLSSGTGSSDIEQILKDNGKTLGDIRFAMGIGSNAAAAAMPTMVYALQVKGLDATKFATAFDSSYATDPSITVGGKPVKGQISGGFGTITYLHNDVVFLALGSEADLNAIVAALP